METLFILELFGLQNQGSLNYRFFVGIKQCECLIILTDFPYSSALFELIL